MLFADVIKVVVSILRVAVSVAVVLVAEITCDQSHETLTDLRSSCSGLLLFAGLVGALCKVATDMNISEPSVAEQDVCAHRRLRSKIKVRICARATDLTKKSVTVRRQVKMDGDDDDDDVTVLLLLLLFESAKG